MLRGFGRWFVRWPWGVSLEVCAALGLGCLSGETPKTLSRERNVVFLVISGIDGGAHGAVGVAGFAGFVVGFRAELFGMSAVLL